MAANSNKVPDAIQPLYESIASQTDIFCREMLNEECAELCRKVAAALARKRPTPLANGKTQTWACGIVYAVAQINFLFDKSDELYITADELSQAFGIAKTTASNKAKAIRDFLKIGLLDYKWALPSRIDVDPRAWMLSVDSVILDIRSCSRDLQEMAFRQGLIPYIPADRVEKERL